MRDLGSFLFEFPGRESVNEVVYCRGTVTIFPGKGLDVAGTVIRSEIDF
jgi:hypothetical protein